MRTHEQRPQQYLHAALVGLLAGLLAVAFRYTLEGMEGFRDVVISFGHTHPAWGWLLPIIFSAVTAGVGLFLVRRFAPEAAGSGIPHLELVLNRLHQMKWLRIILVKFSGGALSIGAGLALGREGPTVQMGGAVGQMVSEKLKNTPAENQALVSAGAGAGLAAAFNAPLSGVVFVLEELERNFTPAVFTATFIACIIADIVTRSLIGSMPTYHLASYLAPPLESLSIFFILGVFAGVLGVIFNRALLASLDLFSHIKHWSTGVIIGAGFGLLGWFLPQVLGGGHHLVEQTLAGQTGLSSLLLFFILRFGLTMISYGSGAAGGIFAPLLVLGAQLGLLVGWLAGYFFPITIPDPTVFAVVGMAALFAAIVRAPLTGIILIVEMTGSFSLMLPLLVACFCAHSVADFMGDKPVYQALFERDLLRSQNNVSKQQDK